MIGERVLDGLLVRLRPDGVARLIPAAFLMLWLCGWAFGEWFAISMLAKGALALINGAPFEEGHSRGGLAFGIAAGGFLLFWLALWTLGGVGAMAGLLRLLWSEDRITASGAGLTLSRSLGPFRFRREIQRDQLRGLSIAQRNGALVADTTKGRVELSRSGSFVERAEAVGVLQAELGLGPAGPGVALTADSGMKSAMDAPVPTTLPKGWQEIITPEGERALVPDLAIRKRQATVVGLVGVAMAGIAFLAVMKVAASDLTALPGALITTFLTVLLGLATAWLVKGRMEWRIGSGRLTLRRRFGSGVKDEFEATRLAVVLESSGDHADWYALYAYDNEPDPAPIAGVRVISSLNKNRRRIAATIRDPLVPRQLGAWLARAAGVPLQDKSTPEAVAVDLKALEEQLSQSGPLGRVAVRFISRIDPNRRKSA